MSDRFERVWQPRVGAPAADLLRKRARFLLVVLAVCAVTVFYGGTLRSDATYNAVVLPLGIILVVVLFVGLARFNRRIAAALSAQLGVQVSARNLPSIRSVERFDRDVEVLKGTRAVTERSFLGGFIKMRTPSRDRT